MYTTQGLTESQTRLLLSWISKSSFKKLASPPVYPASSWRDTAGVEVEDQKQEILRVKLLTWWIFRRPPFLGRMDEFLVSITMACWKVR